MCLMLQGYPGFTEAPLAGGFSEVTEVYIRINQDQYLFIVFEKERKKDKGEKEEEIDIGDCGPPT